MRSQEINHSFQLVHFHMQVAKVTKILVHRLHPVSNFQARPAVCYEAKMQTRTLPVVSSKIRGKTVEPIPCWGGVA